MNIKEVAKLAKVSTATVSRTINGSDKVSARTAERVQKAIKELNFYPNTHARTLVSGRSRMLGLIISDITNPFFPELVKHFEDQAVQKGLEVIIANTDYKPKRMAECIRRMVERKVDAARYSDGVHGYGHQHRTHGEYQHRLRPRYSRGAAASFFLESPQNRFHFWSVESQVRSPPFGRFPFRHGVTWVQGRTGNDRKG